MKFDAAMAALSLGLGAAAATLCQPVNAVIWFLGAAIWGGLAVAKWLDA